MESSFFLKSLHEEESCYFNPELPPVFDSYKEEEKQLEADLIPFEPKSICVEGHGEELEGYEPKCDVGKVKSRPLEVSLMTETRRKDFGAYVLLCRCEGCLVGSYTQGLYELLIYEIGLGVTMLGDGERLGLVVSKEGSDSYILLCLEALGLLSNGTICPALFWEDAEGTIRNEYKFIMMVGKTQALEDLLQDTTATSTVMGVNSSITASPFHWFRKQSLCPPYSLKLGLSWTLSTEANTWESKRMKQWSNSVSGLLHPIKMARPFLIVWFFPLENLNEDANCFLVEPYSYHHLLVPSLTSLTNMNTEMRLFGGLNGECCVNVHDISSVELQFKTMVLGNDVELDLFGIMIEIMLSYPDSPILFSNWKLLEGIEVEHEKYFCFNLHIQLIMGIMAAFSHNELCLDWCEVLNGYSLSYLGIILDGYEESELLRILGYSQNIAYLRIGQLIAKPVDYVFFLFMWIIMISTYKEENYAMSWGNDVDDIRMGLLVMEVISNMDKGMEIGTPTILEQLLSNSEITVGWMEFINDGDYDQDSYQVQEVGGKDAKKGSHVFGFTKETTGNEVAIIRSGRVSVVTQIKTTNAVIEGKFRSIVESQDLSQIDYISFDPCEDELHQCVLGTEELNPHCLESECINLGTEYAEVGAKCIEFESFQTDKSRAQVTLRVEFLISLGRFIHSFQAMIEWMIAWAKI